MFRFVFCVNCLMVLLLNLLVNVCSRLVVFGLVVFSLLVVDFICVICVGSWVLVWVNNVVWVLLFIMLRLVVMYGVFVGMKVNGVFLFLWL